MKISAIKQQVKQTGRYSIFVDGVYAFSLSEAALAEQKLASGQEIDRARLMALKQTSATDKAYGRALRYIAMRPRSEWEIEMYLKRQQVDESVIQQIIQRLRHLGLLDDQKFATTWVNNRRLLKPTSRRRLVQELRQKHIAEDAIQQALDATGKDEQTALKALITKKRVQAKYRQDELKLMQYLARQGFNYDDIKAALSKH